MSGGGYLKFRNDRGIPEIRIGVREFECIGEAPPQDHPHVYINMGQADTILCPYCGTRFRFDSRLTPLDAEPRDSLFADQKRPERRHSGPSHTLRAAADFPQDDYYAPASGVPPR
jgi:uncharacterized Zn-finger protein